MPPQRAKRSSNPAVRRRELSKELLEAVMRPCNNCVRLGRQCLVGPESDRCSSCVAGGRKCDLVVSPLEMRNIENERKRLFAQMSETTAKLSRIQKQLESIEKRKQEIVSRELQNIEELEADERSERVAPSSEDFLFDVSSESFEVPEGLEGFDWPAFPIAHETVAEAPGSSQGS